MKNKLQIKGRLRWEHFSKGGILLGGGIIPNEIKNEGLDEALEILFSTDNLLTWYMGLMDASGFTSTGVADTYALMHLGSLNWQEMNANYYTSPSNTQREPINFGPASGGLITSDADPTVFTISVNGDGETVKGIVVTNQGDYTESSGWLWSTVIIPTRPINEDDYLVFGYEVILGRAP